MNLTSPAISFHSAPRQQAPLRSNIFQSNSCEFTAPGAPKKVGSVEVARQSLCLPPRPGGGFQGGGLGEAVTWVTWVTRDLTPELRVFSFYDKDAVALGHRLHNLSS
eukprot:symbB.v1.2.008367.t1/scaffold524.1/size192337/16